MSLPCFGHDATPHDRGLEAHERVLPFLRPTAPGPSCPSRLAAGPRECEDSPNSRRAAACDRGARPPGGTGDETSAVAAMERLVLRQVIRKTRVTWVPAGAGSADRLRPSAGIRGTIAPQLVSNRAFVCNDAPSRSEADSRKGAPDASPMHEGLSERWGNVFCSGGNRDFVVRPGGPAAGRPSLGISVCQVADVKEDVSMCRSISARGSNYSPWKDL